MSTPINLRELTEADLDEVRERIERIQDLRARLRSSSVLFGAAEGEGPLWLPEVVGHLSSDRLIDLGAAATRLLRLLLLDGLVFGELPLEGLSEEGLLQRLHEVSRIAAQKGVAGLRVDGAKEVVLGLGDEGGGGVSIPLDVLPQQPGDELAPDVGDLGGLVAVEGDLAVPVHPHPPVMRRRAEPPS